MLKCCEIEVQCEEGKTTRIQVQAHPCGLCYHEHLQFPGSYVLTHMASGKMLIKNVVHSEKQAKYWIAQIAALIPWTEKEKSIIEYNEGRALRTAVLEAWHNALSR